MRSAPLAMPITVNGCSPMNTAGRLSSVVMPRRAAMAEPTTATCSARPSWKASYALPEPSVRPAARSIPGEAATTGSRSPLAPATGADRTVVSPSGTGQNTPAARTPLSAPARASASRGKASGTCRPSWGSPPPAVSVTPISVAVSALKRLSICEEAVAVRPRIATKVPTPRTVPRPVSAERAGRWSIPARASESRSRRDSREGTIPAARLPARSATSVPSARRLRPMLRKAVLMR